MFHLLLYFFALSIERTRPDLHFTTDYTLYDCVCDINKNLEPLHTVGPYETRLIF